MRVQRIVQNASDSCTSVFHGHGQPLVVTHESTDCASTLHPAVSGREGHQCSVHCVCDVSLRYCDTGMNRCLKVFSVLSPEEKDTSLSRRCGSTSLREEKDKACRVQAEAWAIQHHCPDILAGGVMTIRGALMHRDLREVTRQVICGIPICPLIRTKVHERFLKTLLLDSSQHQEVICLSL